jgi:signal transduction histidine kinase
MLIKSQEDEKLRISRELHDDIGQELVFIRMKEEIKNKSDIDRIISKISDISYNLKPIKLTDGSIKEILDDLLSNAENDAIFFSYEIEDFTIKNTDIKINLFRIVQEAVNNIIKHSKAQNARVTLSVKDKNIVLEIMDDGIGINETILKNSRSVGLTSMLERAGLINGKLRFEKTEKGTHLKLIFKI